MPQQNLGRIVPSPEGAWDANTPYTKLAIVEYQGSSYICHTTVSVGNLLPTNTSNWYLLAGMPTIVWEDISNKPTEFTPTNHSATKITTGVLADSRIPSTIARDSEVDTKISDAFQDNQIGGMSLINNRQFTESTTVTLAPGTYLFVPAGGGGGGGAKARVWGNRGPSGGSGGTSSVTLGSATTAIAIGTGGGGGTGGVIVEGDEGSSGGGGGGGAGGTGGTGGTGAPSTSGGAGGSAFSAFGGTGGTGDTGVTGNTGATSGTGGTGGTTTSYLIETLLYEKIATIIVGTGGTGGTGAGTNGAGTDGAGSDGADGWVAIWKIA